MPYVAVSQPWFEKIVTTLIICTNDTLESILLYSIVAFEDEGDTAAALPIQ